MQPQPHEPLAHGVWTVVPTPFDETGAIEHGSVARLAAFYDSIGATGLTALGVFGEAAALTADERGEALATIAAHSDLPIVAGITALAAEPAIDEVQRAQSVLGPRLRAVMVQANSARAEALAAHLQRIHAATGAAVVLQDYPRASGISISADALIAAAQACPFVCAVKAEAPPTAVAVARLSVHLPVPVFGGLGGQGLLDELAAGSAGSMTGFSYPEALIACVAAWFAGDAGAARDALLPYLPLINFEQQPGIALAVRKELLHRRGLIAGGSVRAPATPFPSELSLIADAHLARVASLMEVR